MVEHVTPGGRLRHIRVALFDFDGTLSLIRAGWMEIMSRMMVETLAAESGGESESQLRATVEDFIWRLTGNDTIHQMSALAVAVKARNGKPLPAGEYKRMYLGRLLPKLQRRVRALQEGQAPPDHYLVPGSRPLLEALRERGVKLYLASGTDRDAVLREARLLDISHYFDGGIFGALPNGDGVSKMALVRRIASEYAGADLAGFGDGNVEIEAVREAAGFTVGVAGLEPECVVLDPAKRTRLIAAGADCIVPNYLDREELLATLFQP